MSISFPPENTGKGWHRDLWLHSDTSDVDSDYKDCVQSWFTALPVNEGDATLAFLHGSTRKP